MDCIPYINDLQLEIYILDDIKKVCGNEDKVKKIDIKINERKSLIKKCEENLSKLSDNNIEYRLYLKILDGKRPSKAVEEIADENYENDLKPTSLSNIWNYYKKIKKIIKQE